MPQTKHESPQSPTTVRGRFHLPHQAHGNALPPPSGISKMGGSLQLGEGVRHSKATTDKKKADLDAALGGSKGFVAIKLPSS